MKINGFRTNAVKLSASWQDKPLAERESRWLSGAEASKIASAPLSEWLNLKAMGSKPINHILFVRQHFDQQ
ncbi:MAG: hypothetical protein QX196_13050 [Methylococcaceae bacterium]